MLKKQEFSTGIAEPSAVFSDPQVCNLRSGFPFFEGRGGGGEEVIRREAGHDLRLQV